MNRRDFGKLATTAALAALLTSTKNAQAQQQSSQSKLAQEHEDEMKRHAKMMAGEKVTIAMLVYPGMFLQDMVGPLTMFEALMNRDIHLVWKNKEPLNASSILPVAATKTFKECPDKLDVLFVPGGAEGILAMMDDVETLNFLAEKGKTARYITSVGTGSLVLGAAGLLKGYKATSHWAAREVLAEFGAIPTDERIVTDRNRVTGGGVTAGLDFGLALVAKLRTRDYAEAVQLYLEYDPQPPFNAGSLKTAGAAAKQFNVDMFKPFAKTAREAAIRAQKRLG